MRRSFFVVFNSGAGISRSQLLDDVIGHLLRAGAEVEWAKAPSPEAAREELNQAAASARHEAIIAAGGDGTVRHIAAALLGTSLPIGIVPVGTANVLAHEIGLNASSIAISRTLLEGPIVSIPCGRANGEPFLLMVGAGFDGRVVAAVNQHLKSRIGKAAYAAPILRALARPLDALAISIDGAGHEASWAVVANARHYGGRFVMAPRTAVQEPGLQAVLFKAKRRAVLASQLISLALGRLDVRATRRGDVEMHSCSRVDITAPHPVPTQIDGDVFGLTPLEVEGPAAEVALIVPPGTGLQSTMSRPLTHR
jgi:diacylglycerol kinase family enzyme